MSENMVSICIPAKIKHRKRLEYALSFIGTNLGVKFVRREKDAHIYYGESNKATSKKNIFVPYDEGLLKGDLPPFWYKVKEKLILSSAEFDVNLDSIYGRDGEAITFNFDIFAEIFYIISRSEEYYSPKLDKHNRFPYSESVLYKSGSLRSPVVDYLLEDFREALLEFGVSCEDIRTPTAILSHDVDQPVRSVKGSVKLLFVGGFGVIRGLRGLADSIGSRILGRPNPFWNFNKYADSEESQGFRSTFYFANPLNRSPYDPKYDIGEKAFMDLISSLCDRGFEIGLHSSYNSLSAGGDVALERADFIKKIGVQISGNRGHYLRLNISDSFRRLFEAGFSYDSSLGYSSVIGYRGGTGLPFCVYDFENDDYLPLVEIPFTVMDGALFSEMGRGTVDDILEGLITDTKKLRGTIGFLWHIRTAYRNDYPGWFEGYARVLKLLRENNFRVIPPSALAREYLKSVKRYTVKLSE